MSSHNNWHLHELRSMEANEAHQELSVEYRFYRAVSEGDLEYVKENCRQRAFLDSTGKGILSKNPLLNVKYHFVVTTALITRNCVLSGMVHEQAYRLSDFYIQQLDDAGSAEEVEAIHRRMVLDYTGRMLALKKDGELSVAVAEAIDYIYKHIHDRITIDDLANHVGLSRSHLSRLFRNELNISMSEYIRNRKLDRAKNLLQYSDFSAIEISNYLAFASQSHFIRSFENYAGMTPKKYRDRFYRPNWQTEY